MKVGPLKEDSLDKVYATVSAGQKISEQVTANQHRVLFDKLINQWICFEGPKWPNLEGRLEPDFEVVDPDIGTNARRAKLFNLRTAAVSLQREVEALDPGLASDVSVDLFMSTGHGLSMLKNMLNELGLLYASVSPKRGAQPKHWKKYVAFELFCLFPIIAGKAATRINTTNNDPSGPFFNFAAAMFKELFDQDTGIDGAIRAAISATNPRDDDNPKGKIYWPDAILKTLNEISRLSLF